MVNQSKRRKKPSLFDELDAGPLGLDPTAADEEQEETPREKLYRELREKAEGRRTAARKGLDEMDDPMEQAANAEESMRTAQLLKGLMQSASRFGTHTKAGDMSHMDKIAESRMRDASRGQKQHDRLSKALESAENRLLALRKGERGEVFEDAREERAKAGEGRAQTSHERAGEMHDLNKKQKTIQTKETEREVEHVNSRIDDVTKGYLIKGLE